MYLALLAWLAFAYVTMQGLRYLLGARIYLTCALQERESHPIGSDAVEPGELRLLSLFDQELQAAGFTHLGFGLIKPLVTYYSLPGAVVSVFQCQQISVYAIVQRLIAPEYGGLIALEIVTNIAEGAAIVTQSAPHHPTFIAPDMLVESHPAASVGDLVRRHRERIIAAGVDTGAVQPATLDDILESVSGRFASLRQVFRRRGWAVATADPRLDRFTLKGAFMLAHSSMRLLGKRTARAARQPLPLSVEELKALRVEADLIAVQRIADSPEPAPGPPWPLMAVIAATALVSFIAMSVLWDPVVAAIILGVIAFHEAGHAFAMRAFGYRDVHVFFVPLLGGLTIGSPAATTVRQRLAVLLAGPFPGLCLAVVLLALEQATGPSHTLRAAALALLILNGLNLLPVTPLDGGRALESLIRPESPGRLIIHAVSALGLLVLAVRLEDPFLAIFGIAWAVLMPRQILAWRLRRSVAAAVSDPTDRRQVLRAALECMTSARYSSWRAPVRQVTARALVRLFSESVATPSDRLWGVLAYACCWVPVALAVMMWRS